MKNPNGKVAMVADAESGGADAREETSPRRAGIASEQEQAEKKPQASEEIVIEEISIDGMCGVY